jgi:hypothetical protein
MLTAERYYTGKDYLMKTANFILACFSTLVLLSMLGCAFLGGGQASGINWALEKNGGKVTAFSEDPNHPTSTLINGITSSENWDQGEGWQAPIGPTAGRGRGGFGGMQMPGANTGRGRRGFGAMRQERNWVIIELSQPVSVSHVKIHTVDSQRYPAKDFGVSHLLVQYEGETSIDKDKIWINADRYGKGVGSRDNIIRDNVNGVIDVRFPPVRTQRIRVIIYGTNDMSRSEDSNRIRGGTIRLTEIEVYGT